MQRGRQGSVLALLLLGAQVGAVWVNGTQKGVVKPLRLFMCITGQAERLETTSKLENFVKAQHAKGHIVDVAAVLDPRSDPRYVNHIQLEIDDFSKAEDPLEIFKPYTRYTSHVVYTQPENPEVPTRYRDGLMKDSKPNLDPNERAQNHVRQFASIERCDDVMMDLEWKAGEKYDEVLRIRDDGYILAPFPLINEMEEEDKPDIVTQKCDNWFGVNDKAALMTRASARSYFQGFFKEVFLRTPDKDTHNPETLTLSMFKHEGLKFKEVCEEFPVTCLRGRIKDGNACLHMRMLDCWNQTFENMGFNVTNTALPWCDSDVHFWDYPPQLKSVQ